MQDLPSADRMLSDVVMNIQVGGICKHFSDLFEHGQGLVTLKFLGMHAYIYSLYAIPEGVLLEIANTHAYER